MEPPRLPVNLFTTSRQRPEGRAEWPLRWLLAASIGLPIALFALGSMFSYRQHMAEARDRLQRDVGRLFEHGLKVFETFDLSARYLDEILRHVTDEQIVAAEESFHLRLKAVTDTLPQLADLWVIDRAGHPVVSGTVFPMPRQLDLSDREYFRAHKDNSRDEIYISDVMQARTANAQGQPRFFALSRKRLDSSGTFAGVTTISISPDYFIDCYAQQPPP
jgi:two-component system, NtrC family, sensor kinase